MPYDLILLAIGIAVLYGLDRYVFHFMGGKFDGLGSLLNPKGIAGMVVGIVVIIVCFGYVIFL